MKNKGIRKKIKRLEINQTLHFNTRLWSGVILLKKEE